MQGQLEPLAINVNLADARKAFDDEMAAFRAAHPNGFHASDPLTRNQRLRIAIDGVDVTNVSLWADATTGEAGLYPHSITDGCAWVIDTSHVLPLVSELPGFEREGLPLIVVRGRVEVTNAPEN